MRVVAKLQNYYQDLATQQLMLSQSPDAEQWRWIWQHSKRVRRWTSNSTGNCVRDALNQTGITACLDTDDCSPAATV